MSQVIIFQSAVRTLLTIQLAFFKHHQESGFTLIEKLIIVAVIGIMGAIAAPNFQGFLNRMKVEQAVTKIRGALDETQRQAVRNNKLCNITLNLNQGEVSGDCLVTGERTIAKEVQIATNLLPEGMGTSAANTPPSEPNPEVSPAAVVADMSPNLVLSANRAGTKIALAPGSDQDLEPFKAAVVIHIIASNPATGGECQGWKKWYCTENSGGTFEARPIPPIPIRFGVLGNAEFAVASNADTPVDPTGKIVLFLPNHSNIKKQCVAISNTLGLTRMGEYTGELDPPAITDHGVCKAANWEKQ
jgi:type II secretory pathway pseudopilin PulG